jgi:AcrR family transcriptional regulator
VTRLCEEGLSPRDAALAVDFTADLTVAAEISVRRMSRLFETPRGSRSLQELYGGPVPGESRREWLDEKLTIMLDGLASRLGEPVTVSRPDIPTPPRQAASEPTRDTVAETGRRIARRSGLPAVSVRAVAGELGVSVSAVRRVAGDRDGIVVAMLDAVAGDLVVPPPSPDPRTELLALAAAGYTVMAPDPWSIIALAVDGLAAPAIMPVAERVFVAFRAAGVPDDALGHANRILWGHVYGAVLNQAPPDTFARRVATSVDLPPPTGPAVPTLGIEIIVDGLLNHLAR